jgi:Tol biopolymer transport system component
MNRKRIRMWAVVAFALVLAVPALDSGVARAAFPGRNGLIAWTRLFLTRDAEIWVMTPGGQTKRSIDRNDQNDAFPAWSANGRLLAFESSSATDVDLWVMRIDGGAPVNITNDPGNADRQPAWSPTGDAIVFSRQSPFTGLGAIWVIEADGSIRQLTEDTSVNQHPAWSPDGQWILFSSDRDGNLELYRVRPDGTGEGRVTFTPTVHEDNPNWAPDGAKVAFDACQAESFPCPGSPNYEIFSINADGTGRVRLTDVEGIDWNPAWSPDGTQIVFRSDRTGSTQLWKMNADGSSPTQLTFAEFEGGVDPDWQPLPEG